MSLEMRLILAVFATYRLAGLVVYDKGPFDAFKRLRAYLGMHSISVVRANLGSLVNCPYCVGVWAALAVLGLVLWQHAVANLALIWLGLAGGQALLEDIRRVGK